MKAWPILGILIVQSLLCLAHWFLYCTWIDFWWPVSPATVVAVSTALIVLSVVFVAAALMGFRYTHWLVALLYQIAATWLGLLNFLFFGACLAWLIDIVWRVTVPGTAHLQARPAIATVLLVVALAAGIYGIFNAKVIRVRRVQVKLERLPESWQGRVAMVFSDMHLGNINGIRFARRIAKLAVQLNPDVILIPGDLFDGTKAEPEGIAQPLLDLTPPLGVYFVSGNHEEFGGSKHYADAMGHHGFHVLNSERAWVDGLQIVGVSYESSTHPMGLRHFLMGLKLNEGPASVLLQHVPNRLPIVEQAGVSLMLSGHTHGGQVFPFSWVTRRAFGKFTYGLQRYGSLQVLTSSGVGTWGPPMRVGTHPEVLLLTFE